MDATSLSRRELDAVKGLLILAVVAGHNEPITSSCAPLRQLFYYFHVQCFFLMSSYLGERRFSWQLLRDRAVRYLVPHGWFVAIACGAYQLVRDPGRSPSDAFGRLAMALAVESGDAITAATGLQYLWFLPALLGLVILRAIACRWPRIGIAVTAAAISWMLACGLIGGQTVRMIPYGLGSSLFFYGLGELAGPLLRRARRQPEPLSSTAIWSLVITIALTLVIVMVPLGWVAAANVATYDVRQPLTWVVGLAYPVAILFLLFVTRGALASYVPFSPLLGRLSLPIYLVHMFVYRVLLVMRFGHDWDSLEVVGRRPVEGIAILMATILVSVFIAVAFECLPGLKRLVFPRDWSDCCRMQSTARSQAADTA